MASTRRTAWPRIDVRCTAAAREGRMNLDLASLRGAVRERAMQFWSNVDIGWADECWEWKGSRIGPAQNPMFSWRRSDVFSSPTHHPQRIAMWLSWGDLGRYRVKSLCGNRYCCNPYHLTPVNIGVCLDSSNVDDFELASDVLRLRQEVMGWQAMKDQAAQNLDLSKEAEELIIDPVPTEITEPKTGMVISNDSQHAQNILRVMDELLGGHHTSSSDLLLDIDEDDL